jgi:hypothetical protein
VRTQVELRCAGTDGNPCCRYRWEYLSQVQAGVPVIGTVGVPGADTGEVPGGRYRREYLPVAGTDGSTRNRCRWEYLA